VTNNTSCGKKSTHFHVRRVRRSRCAHRLTSPRSYKSYTAPHPTATNERRAGRGDALSLYRLHRRRRRTRSSCTTAPVSISLYSTRSRFPPVHAFYALVRPCVSLLGFLNFVLTSDVIVSYLEPKIRLSSLSHSLSLYPCIIRVARAFYFSPRRVHTHITRVTRAVLFFYATTATTGRAAFPCH